jgi:hypothetical protein
VNAVNLWLLYKWQAVEDRLRTCAKKNTRRKMGKPGRQPTYPEQDQQWIVKVKDACQQGWSFTWKHVKQWMLEMIPSGSFKGTDGCGLLVSKRDMD